MDWSAERIVVTGGATGIGRRITEVLAELGATVLIADHDPTGGAATVDEFTSRGLNVHFREMDVTNEESVLDVFSTDAIASNLTVLVNNAAHLGGDGLVDMDVRQWDADIAVVLRGTFLCTRSALRSMLPRKSGVIVNIGSTNALAFAGAEAYSAAKAAVLSLTRSVAVRYGEEGIRCVAVVPATIVTAAWDSRIERDPLVLSRMREMYPTGRLGTPDDVAKAVKFLVSDEASWVSGSALYVDGGITSGRAGVAKIAFPPAP